MRWQRKAVPASFRDASRHLVLIRMEGLHPLSSSPGRCQGLRERLADRQSRPAKSFLDHDRGWQAPNAGVRHPRLPLLPTRQSRVGSGPGSEYSPAGYWCTRPPGPIQALSIRRVEPTQAATANSVPGPASSTGSSVCASTASR